MVKVIPPTLDALQNQVAGISDAIIHFTGHGGRDDAQRDGFVLFFERNNASAAPVTSNQFLSTVRGRASLVVLSACLSGTMGVAEESSLASVLAEHGIPFVLGMQLSVPDPTARKFTDKFYRFLFAGEGIFEAVRQARLAVLNDPDVSIGPFLMGIPVLYASRADDFVFGPSTSGFRPYATAGHVKLDRLTGVQTGMFFGRQREMVQIGKILGRERPVQNQTYPPLTVTLHGPGGIGKTALLRQAATRFGWMFRDGTLDILLEPLPTPGSVYERIEKFIGIADQSTLSSEDRAENLLKELQGRRLLLALDNFESIFLARKDENRRDDASLLYKFLRALPARGVTLMISSRQVTDLPGEVIVDLPGLDSIAGGHLFASAVNKRATELTEDGLARVNQRVGGHPLALRLLGPQFNNGIGASLDDFITRITDLLPKAADKWNEGLRHDTLKACFDFTLANLGADEQTLRGSIARLSMFHGQFIHLVVAPALYGVDEVIEAEQTKAESYYQQASQVLLELYERGLLERVILYLGESDSIAFYSVHPALQPFAVSELSDEESQSARAAWWQIVRNLARRCYPASEGGGIHANPLLAQIARRALPDLLLASSDRPDREGSTLAFHTAFLLRHFGDLDGAMKLYQQSLEIKEGLGDLKGKSATLHEMAYIFTTRGDLDGAMKLYQQSLEIKEGLGDLQGKSATLAMNAQLLSQRQDHRGALTALIDALNTLVNIGAGPDAEKVAGIIVSLRSEMNPAGFDSLWKELTGQDLPGWLVESSESEKSNEGIGVEQFVDQIVEAARSKSPQASQYFEAMSKMAADASAPKELQALANVLQRILTGNLNPDLSSLPPEFAEVVKRALRPD